MLMFFKLFLVGFNSKSALTRGANPSTNRSGARRADSSGAFCVFWVEFFSTSASRQPSDSDSGGDKGFVFLLLRVSYGTLVQAGDLLAQGDLLFFSLVMLILRCCLRHVMSRYEI